MNVLKKIIVCYHDVGFKGIIKKIIRKVRLKILVMTYSYFSSKSMKSVVLKKRKIYLFIRQFNYENNQFLLKFVTLLNNMGYSIILISDLNFKKYKLPVSCQFSFQQFHDVEVDFENGIFIFDKKDKIYKPYFNLIKEPIFLTDKYLKKIDSYYEKLLPLEKRNEKYYGNISIVVLNYNNKNVIFRCIDTLKKFNQKYHYEIIVVDNQSTDGSYELLQKEDGIKLLRNGKNGCSSGRNLGVKEATGDYIVFLDSDQWILNSRWLDPYFEVLENDSIGAVGWAAGWFDRKGYSYYITDDFPLRYMPTIGLYRTDIGYLGSGGMMISKELFYEIDGFDEMYDPTCYEDTDISLKVRDIGKELAYCPYLGVGHLPHQTTKSGSKAHEILIKEKGDYFVNKWNLKNKDLLKYVK